MKDNIGNVEEKDCCGCGACYQVCPKRCISMEENERGFLTPKVNNDFCVECGLCKKICPERNAVSKGKITDTYAAVSKDKNLLLKSTSGGIFALLSSSVLRKGGVVFGCAWSNELEVQYIMITDEQQLKKLQGSKYVQSNTLHTFREAKERLENGQFVLYSGTGCQLAGLKRYLGKEYEKLLLVEVACHGVPSPGLFRQYILYQEIKNEKRVKAFTFRNRKLHKKGEHYQLKIEFDDGTSKYCFSYLDPYYSSFISAKTLRKTCYSCKYRGEERVSDILLADFWGIEKEHPSFPGRYGASAVMIYTEKGAELFDAISDQIIVAQSDIKKVVAHNNSLLYSANGELMQEINLNNLDKDRLMKSLKPKTTPKTVLKIIIPEKIKYILKSKSNH